ncbi:putative sporulation protein YtxC [Brevibacillus brevis]|uniref:Sporulation protein YtxC n=1 Tax=Brevibacillus brevis TaxID=1393 RepID=A0ABY9T8Q1_BREBE|nr:putative sporulation protein YtxC [Brevibacillus brevis]WNC16479.1 putative sporulation protein YtxC [Brevibacillus brevis]
MQTFRVLLENVPAHCGTYRAILQEMTERVNTAPVRITYKEQEQDEYRLFHFQSWCEEEYDAQTIDWARAFVALTLAEWIMQVKEPEIVEEMAADLLEAEQLEEEWADILPYVTRSCQEHEPDGRELFAATTRKANVYRKAFTFLEQERTINVLGFVRFRLQDHWNELFELVESGIDDYLEDKQYQEFVELLRYFIAVQETKQEVVHVVPSVDKPFHLYDKKGERLWLDQLDVVLSMDEQKCRDEDYLISALVTLAPETIVLHLASDRPGLIQTIRSIFESRLSTCQSCPLCLTSRRLLDVHNPTKL